MTEYNWSILFSFILNMYILKIYSCDLYINFFVNLAQKKKKLPCLDGPSQ